MIDVARHILRNILRPIGYLGTISSLVVLFMSQTSGADSVRLVPPDPWEVIHTARDHGPAEVGRDAMRDPLISGEVAGQPYELVFYDCWLGRECTTVLFQARLKREEWTPEAEDIDAWNREKLFGRAWIEDDSTAVLDHAVAMHGGLPKEVLDAAFAAWGVALQEYVEAVDF